MMDFVPELFEKTAKDVIEINIEVEMELGADSFEFAASKEAMYNYIHVVHSPSVSMKRKMTEGQLEAYNWLVNEMFFRLDQHGFLNGATVEQRGIDYSVYCEFNAHGGDKTVIVTFRVANHEESGFNPNDDRLMYSFNVNDKVTYPDARSLIDGIEKACCEIDDLGYSPI